MKNAVVIAGVFMLLFAGLPDAIASWVTSQNDNIELLEEHVTMNIKENIALQKFKATFQSHNSSQTEAEFFMGIAPDEKVDKFIVTIDGKEQKAELLDAEKARKIYEEIVAKRKDPALLEYYGYGLLRVRIFPIAPKSVFEVNVELTQTLKSNNGLVRIQSLNANPSSSLEKVKKVSFQAVINSSKPVRTIFSPTHDITISRKDTNNVQITYQKDDYVPQSPLILYYNLDSSKMAANLFSYVEPGKDGYFMLTLSPHFTELEALPRDVVFSVDISGSMKEGDRIGQVKTALGKFIDSLGDNDRFNIVTYSTEANKYQDGFIKTSESSKKAAKLFVEDLASSGGTNIEEAIKKSYDHEFRKDAVKIILFLTDGLPTIGERNTDKLVNISRNAQGIRVFCFGVGFDVNTQLLDLMATENRGDRIYMHPKDDIKTILETFVVRLNAPLVGNPSVNIDNAITEIFPKNIPDIFNGQELIIFGRFKGEGERTVTLKGNISGKEKEFSYKLNFKHNNEYAFVPRLWATQKIDFLLDEIRRKGAQKELIDHIVELSKKYGIVTPYTSLLIIEDAPVDSVSLNKNVEKILQESKDDKFNGIREFSKVDNQQKWRNCYNNEAQYRNCNQSIDRNNDASSLQKTMSRMRQVSNRAFYNCSNKWVDADFDGDRDGKKVKEVKFMSDEYFELLKKNKEVAQYLALGKEVTFQCDNQWYTVK